MRKLYILSFLLVLVYTATAQESPRELFKFAKFKFDKGEYEEALSYLSQTLDHDSTYSNAYLLRAEIKFMQARLEAKISKLEKLEKRGTHYDSKRNSREN